MHLILRTDQPENKKRKPAHPGRILKEHYLKNIGLELIDGVAALSQAINIKMEVVGDIINEKRGVDVDMALRLSKALGTSPTLWLNMQLGYDLWNALNEKDDWKNIEPLV